MNVILLHRGHQFRLIGERAPPHPLFPGHLRDTQSWVHHSDARIGLRSRILMELPHWRSGACLERAAYLLVVLPTKLRNCPQGSVIRRHAPLHPHDPHASLKRHLPNTTALVEDMVCPSPFRFLEEPSLNHRVMAGLLTRLASFLRLCRGGLRQAEVSGLAHTCTLTVFVDSAGKMPISRTLLLVVVRYKSS